MTTDEQLIERIQSSMKAEVAGLVPPRELLDAIEAPRSRGLRMPSLGGAVAALGSVVAVAIALVAVAFLSHAPSHRRSGLAEVAPTTVRGLVAELAVLRRRQSAADKLPKWAARAVDQPGQEGTLITGLTRLIATEPSGQRVYMLVELGKQSGPPGGGPSSGLLSGHTRSQALHVWLIGLTRTSSDSADRPGFGQRSGQLALSPGVILMADRNVGLVPDGVTRVKWVFDGMDSKAHDLYPTIRGNVASARPFPGQYWLRSATWYAADGSVISSYSDASLIDRQNHLDALSQAALDASYRQRIAPALRAHFAVARLPRLKGFVAGGISHNLAAKIVASNPYGLNVAYAHFVPYGGASHVVLASKGGAFVILGSNGACLSGSDSVGTVLPGFSCVRLERVSSGSFHVTTKTVGGSRTVVGLVPDGNASVGVLLPGGHERTARVFDNIWSLTLPTTPVTLLVKNAAGQRVRVTL